MLTMRYKIRVRLIVTLSIVIMTYELDGIGSNRLSFLKVCSHLCKERWKKDKNITKNYLKSKTI